MYWDDLNAQEMIEDPFPPFTNGSPLWLRETVQELYKFVWDGCNASLGYNSQGKVIDPVITDANVVSFLNQYFTFTQANNLNFANIRSTLDQGSPVYISSQTEYLKNGVVASRDFRGYLLDGYIYRTATTGYAQYFHFEFGLGPWANGWYYGTYSATYKPIIIITIPNTDVDSAMIRTGMGSLKAFYMLNLKPEYR